MTLTCRVLKLCRAQYYRWLTEPVTDSERIRAQRLEALRATYADDPQVGYRYLRDEAATAGIVMCKRTAWQLCSEHRLWSSYRTKRGKNGKRLGPPVHDGLLAHIDNHGRTRHDLVTAASRANQVWVTDITEHPTREGRLYFYVVKDMYSNRIVGYAAAPHMSSVLAVSALNTAVARRQLNGHDVTGCIVHANLDSQFRSRKYRQILRRHGLVGFMGRVASAGDNAAMESFFSLLQRNTYSTLRHGPAVRS